ncbi:MAG: 16S rRNA pseudouridine(516) synthase [Zoogloeaceae bacterium]|nr:16S rRNA pseudouridine(516) synthase [Rhodocyclaceae bacterium]MCP5237055.1 16S rRNA pseudouridine(516) synthase [Zoogloeaceae bacterium]
MQLERIIHSQGFGSRKECRALIRAGMVSIDDEPVLDPKQDFATESLNFEVDGERWHYREQAHLMMNKPPGYECSRQPQCHPSIYALLPWPVVQRGVQSVGRLDQDSSGLLLFSDDGQFIHRWSSGKKQVPKIYRAWLGEDAGGALADRLLAGVGLNDEPEPIRAVACRLIEPRLLELTVTEGKYHLVKRMVAAAGGHVERLRRIRIGGLALPDDLAEGEWRWLDEAAIAALADG